MLINLLRAVFCINNTSVFAVTEHKSYEALDICPAVETCIFLGKSLLCLIVTPGK